MKRVLAIAAHPDDIEFLMTGTLLRLKQAGYELHYWNLANGCCGSTVTDADETARIRLAEAKQSANYLGAEFHEPICDDLSIFYDRETLAKVTSQIRAIQPTIVPGLQRERDLERVPGKDVIRKTPLHPDPGQIAGCAVDDP